MNKYLRFIALACAAATLALTGPVVANAGGKHGHYKHGHGHHHHYVKPHHKERHYRRYDSDDDEKLIYGLLVGGLFGYVIGNASQPDTTQYITAPSPQYPQPTPGSTCLQEREYRMKVMVGGKEADAYGTACLQPDGSWYREPARISRY